MLFDSPAYFLFLIPVVAVYWRLSHRAQNIFLLLASYFFYGWWDWRFLALMIASTTMDFLIAQRITPSRTDSNRKKWFVLSLVLNFGILGVFKYFDFFTGSFSTALETLGIHHIPLLLIRVILPQVQKDRAFDADRFFDGLMLIFSGLVRKCVVADNCALLANAAFGGQFGPPNLWVVLIGTYAFAWQVYGDFSGYSDIARGSAQLMGFHFMVNFRQPYLAHRLQDFWRRWHISLSTWLRDYLYIPLGGSAGGNWKTSLNLLTTMILAGLWHGANWTFVIFGAIHGVVLGVERQLFPTKKVPSDAAQPSRFMGLLTLWGQRILTFNIFCLSLAFFRATSLSAATQFLAGLSNFAWRSEYLSAFLMLSLFSIPLFVVDLLMEASNQEYPFATTSYAFRTGLATMAFIVLAFFSGNNLNAFVYFRF